MRLSLPVTIALPFAVAFAISGCGFYDDGFHHHHHAPAPIACFEPGEACLLYSDCCSGDCRDGQCVDSRDLSVAVTDLAPSPNGDLAPQD